MIIDKNKLSKDFISLHFGLSDFVFFKAKKKLIFLLSEYFKNVYGMGFETIKNIFYGKSPLKLDSEIVIECLKAAKK